MGTRPLHSAVTVESVGAGLGGEEAGILIPAIEKEIGSGFRITEVRPTRGLHLSTEEEGLLKWSPYPALRSADRSSSTFFSYEF